jgi:hypothetical protein
MGWRGWPGAPGLISIPTGMERAAVLGDWRTHRKWVVLAAVAASLAACSGYKTDNMLDYITPGKVPVPPPVVTDRYPERYRTDIADVMRTWLENPGKVKDAFIGQPVLKPMSGTPLYVTCVRYNARTAGGQYMGETSNVVVFLDGRVGQFLPGDPQICAGLSYQRYPELEQLGPPT